MDRQKEKRFAVGLSFPGEYKDRVGAVAALLCDTFTQKRVLFNDYCEAEFARPNLDTYLQNLFINETELVVIFLCQAYIENDWCGVEWRANRTRINARDSQSVMFLSLDSGFPNGFQKGVDYSLDVSKKTPSEIARIIVDRYNFNRDNSVQEALADPYAKLKQYLSHHLEQTRDNHPSFQLMRIDEKLFPYCTNLYNMDAIDDSNTQKPIYDIIAESWNRGQNHLMIEGEGGIGKTVTLLSIPDKIVKKSIPAVFVQLHQMKEGESIKDYIKSSVFYDEEYPFKQFDELTKIDWENGPIVLLLLDGFNEISNERRRDEIGADINRWASRPGVQIITTSRFYHHFAKLGRGWSRVQLQLLNQDVIDEFLKRWDLPTPKNIRQQSVLAYPLMLTLFAQTERALNYIENTNDGLQDFRKRNNAGCIIWNYIQREIGRLYLENSANAVISLLSAEFIAPYIAWQMQKKGLYSLDEYSFWHCIDSAYDIISGVELKSFPPHIQRVLRKHGSKIPSSCEIQSFMVEDLRLFITNGTTYTLMHQQFRDALAAIHLINVSYLCPETVLHEDWRIPIDNEVLSFVSELASRKETNRLWLQNKMGGNHDDIATINMLELQKLERTCDFSDLDFSGLDLRNISLFYYRCRGSLALQLPRSGKLCEGLSISEKTFYPEGHSGDITIIAITPDGKRCISGSSDNSIRILDLKSGRWVGTLIGHDNRITALAITSDGRKCVSGSADNTLRVWDLDSGECLQVLKGHTGAIKVLALSPEGKCVSKSWDRTLRVWDIKTGQCLRIFNKNDGVLVTTIALSPDGRKCVSGSWQYALHLWDLESGQSLRFLEGYKVALLTLAITPDGKKCIGDSWDNTLRVWDLDSGQVLHVLKGHGRPITALAVISNDRCISGSADETLRMWDLNSGKCIKVLEGHDNFINTLSVIPGGKRCVSGSDDNTLRIWDMETGDFIRLDGHDAPVTTHAVTSDGMVCVSGSRDKTLRIWSLEYGRCLRIIEGWEKQSTQFSFSSDRRRCVIGSSDSTLRVWDLESGICKQILEAQEGPVTNYTLTSNGDKCISVSAEKVLCVWDLNLEGSKRLLKGINGPITSVATTPDGKRCVCIVRNDTLCVWDLDREGRKRMIPGHFGFLSFLAITPDGKRCVEIGNRTICIWDLETGHYKVIHEGTHWGIITAFAITPDGKRCITGSRDNTIRIWDLYSGEHLGTLEGHKDSITTLAISLDGKQCVSGSADKTIRVWDLETQDSIMTLKGHEDSIKVLDITPNGKMCVSASDDSTICVWDLQTGEHKKIEAFVTALAVTPDGERCFGGSSEGLLYEWNLQTLDKKTVRILPLTIKGIDFSLANVSDELRETLKQNGAIV